MSAPNTYQNFRTKTINWCQNLQKAGIFSNDQMDSCIASVDLTGTNNQLSFQTPPSGPELNYSIYNKTPVNIKNTFDIVPQNRNFITNSQGAYLSEDASGSIYFNTANIDTSDVNQPDLIWTLIAQQTQSLQHYAIASPYGHYLIANADYSVTSNGTAIGPASLWTISITDSHIIAESVMYTGYYLNFDPNFSAMTLTLDKNEFSAWTLYPVLTDTISTPAQQSTNTVQILSNQKQQILTTLQNMQKHLLALQSSIQALDQLSSIVNDRYIRVKEYILSSLNTQGTLSSDIKLQIINKITTAQNVALSDIASNIANYTQQITTFQAGDYATAQKNYNDFKQTLISLAAKNTAALGNNSAIINRQNVEYNNYMEKTRVNSQSINSYNDDQELLKINMDIMSSYSSSNNIYSYVYPTLIVVLLLCIIFASYSAYKKYKKNILSQYD